MENKKFNRNLFGSFAALAVSSKKSPIKFKSSSSTPKYTLNSHINITLVWDISIYSRIKVLSFLVLVSNLINLKSNSLFILYRIYMITFQHLSRRNLKNKLMFLAKEKPLSQTCLTKQYLILFCSFSPNRNSLILTKFHKN